MNNYLGCKTIAYSAFTLDFKLVLNENLGGTQC